MAARPTWKGYLKISLVNIPIKVFPATDDGATLSFNQLHAECRTRIQQKRWCPHCQREVPNTDIVKGYEFEKGHYVVVDEEDVEKVRVESTRVINLERFTDDTAIDPIYLERPYYLAPDGPVANEYGCGYLKDDQALNRIFLNGRPRCTCWRVAANFKQV